MILLASPLLAEEQSIGWAEALAERFSSAFEGNRRTHARLISDLEGRPVMPVSDFGGPVGYLTGWSGTGYRPELEEQRLEVNWEKEEPVDFVCLVPARVFDEFGLNPQYGLPEDFDVVLTDSDGRDVAVIGRERDTGLDGLRKGTPFCYRLDPPVMCSGMRIDASRNHRDPDRPGNWQFMAWGEIMCFDGDRNVASGAGISVKNRAASPWPWWPTFVVDGVTGLGLPEVPPAPESGIGWLTGGALSREASAWVTVDLRSNHPVTGVRLFPPQRPVGELFAGFAFPDRFVVEISSSGEADDYHTVVDHSQADYLNPGHHPVLLTWSERSARFVRVRALQLNRISANYPSFMGFSEIEVISDGRNVAEGSPVSVSEQSEPVRAHGELFWTPESLTDGHGSRGRIISERRWIELLDERRRIEVGIHQLDLEAEEIVRNYRRATVSGASLLGLSMLAGLVVLPIRYKRREKQHMRQLRNRIASDLHDEIGSSLGSIQMLTEAAQRKPRSSPERLRLISILSAASVASLRDIVWLLRPGSAFQSPSVSHFRETASILIDSVDWEIECDAASRACMLARETNRHLLLFFREALHNAIRHSDCTSIRIRTSLEDGVFGLDVADDGCGISPRDLEAPSCLRALKERATQLGGEFGVRSDPATGTTVSLTFPVDRSNSSKSS